MQIYKGVLQNNTGKYGAVSYAVLTNGRAGNLLGVIYLHTTKIQHFLCL